MKYLLLGGAGFMGTHLTKRLLADGNPVRIYGHPPDGFRPVPAEAEFVEGDLGNAGLVREAVGGMEVVFHFVSTTLPKTSNDDPVYDVRSNLVDTLQVLEACVEAGVRKVVFVSSGGTVYGPPREIPIPEDHPTNPINSYGIVKLAIEKYLHLFRHLHGLDYTVLRASNPYGPCQDPGGQQGVVTVFLHRIHTRQKVTVWGDGSVVRDYLYVSDLVDALALAAGAGTKSRVFNIGSGKGVSLNEMLSLMAEVTGEEPEVKYLPGRALDVPANVLDVRRAREELGWKPRVDLEKGLAETWAWIRTLERDRLERGV